MFTFYDIARADLELRYATSPTCIHRYVPHIRHMDGEGGGRQPGARPGDAYGAAANANATIHKRRDAFTETTPICPPPSFSSSPPPFAFLFFHRGFGGRCVGAAVGFKFAPLSDRRTGLRIAMISRRRGPPRARAATPPLTLFSRYFLSTLLAVAPLLFFSALRAFVLGTRLF